ncbi:unnamed protein product [Trichobilharzia regenti]|nr:unnamed protein product [Trichobilharzia regenti]
MKSILKEIDEIIQNEHENEFVTNSDERRNCWPHMRVVMSFDYHGDAKPSSLIERKNSDPTNRFVKRDGQPSTPAQYGCKITRIFLWFDSSYKVEGGVKYISNSPKRVAKYNVWENKFFIAFHWLSH